MILALLKDRRIFKMSKVTKEQWIRMFRETGLTDIQMQNWHRTFERTAPDGHQEFLEFLNIPKEEIKAIRSRFS
jgi:transposase